ncbi:aminotransferase class I and II domain-containing protein [Ditylenchus destructor]|uniref:Aspartate aminotransferase n=1 Tax=Ditylenchus destructor TaxID=166010 RepID=A0AAD4MFA1_9BILA|nr:aminotransferase class I and II domain-containing protein [Ditylenchus destructor]
MAPRDPILGLNEQFAADTNPNKVNLGVGVYFDDNGKLPLLECVQAAEKAMMEKPTARGYLPIDGIAAYDNAVKALVFGADSEPVTSGRVATIQAIGGTGGLKVGADFLKKLNPNAKVLISDPSWENHRALFTNAGFEVESYPYYDAAKRGINFDGMLAALNAAPAGTIVVLHACCHNPTGYDITPAQWDQVVAAVKAKGLVPFLDMAYQGFGYGLKEDGAAVAKFVAAGLTFFVSTSFSKSFSLYGERVGALSVLCENKEEAARVLSPAQDRHPHQLQQPAHARRRRGGRSARQSRAARPLGEGAGRDARAHQGHAPGAGRRPEGRRREGRHELHHHPDRHVQLLGPHQGPDGAPAQRVRRVRHRHRPHVRGRAQQQEHRARLRFDRQSHLGDSNV